MLTSGSVILAMSYAKLVVAPSLAGVAACLANATDLLYNPEEEDGLQTALESALDIDLADLGRHVRAACDRFDWDPIAKAVRDRYRNTLAG